ncbi:class I SAM-dependent methyltransferase [Patescibacteria group bacterium]|nr:class I SAM-dependent methyltransferase [Patescibacteria group bacterium]
MESMIQQIEKQLESNIYHQLCRKDIAKVVASIKNRKGKILEIGCGSGEIAKKYIRPYCEFLIATDIVKRFEGSKIADDIPFQIEDALHLSFDDKTFDGVISRDVIEHVMDDELFIAESLRVLKKGGVLFFTTPNRFRLTAIIRYLCGRPIRFPHSYGSGPGLGEVVHIREYSLGDLRRLLKKFNVKSIEIYGVYLGIPHCNIGLARFPKFLSRFAYSWHFTMVKR